MLRIRGKRIVFPITIGMIIFAIGAYFVFSGALFCFLVCFNDADWSMTRLWEEATKSINLLYLSSIKNVRFCMSLAVLPLIDIVISLLFSAKNPKEDRMRK